MTGCSVCEHAECTSAVTANGVFCDAHCGIRTTPPAEAPRRPATATRETDRKLPPGKGAIIRLCAEVVRAAAGLEDDEAVTLGPAEPLRVMAMAAKAEIDSRHDAIVREILVSLRDEMCLGCTNGHPTEEGNRRGRIHRQPDGGFTYCMCSVYVRARLAELDELAVP